MQLFRALLLHCLPVWPKWMAGCWPRAVKSRLLVAKALKNIDDHHKRIDPSSRASAQSSGDISCLTALVFNMYQCTCIHHDFIRIRPSYASNKGFELFLQHTYSPLWSADKQFINRFFSQTTISCTSIKYLFVSLSSSADDVDDMG